MSNILIKNQLNQLSLIKSLLISAFLFTSTANANLQCTQLFINKEKIITDAVNQSYEITKDLLSQKKRNSFTNSKGQTIAYDFIPGSKNVEPIVIVGGLWYKLDYFEQFLQVQIQNLLIQKIASHQDDISETSFKNLGQNMPPIIVVARATQVESLIEASKKGKRQSINVFNPKSLHDHAIDTKELIENLRQSQTISSKPIHLASLSYGATVLLTLSQIWNDHIKSLHIIAPLAKSGDNFPQETVQLEGLIEITQTPITRLLNSSNRNLSLKVAQPFLRAMNAATSNSFHLATANQYATKLIKGSIAKDADIITLSKKDSLAEKHLTEALANDMYAARPDKFLLDSPQFDLYFSKSVIYLAGDEEPARFSAQYQAYKNICARLKEKQLPLPVLVIVDNAQHALNATAPFHLSHMFGTFIQNEAYLQAFAGRVVYLNRFKNQQDMNLVNETQLKMFEENISQRLTQPNTPSILELFFAADIYNQKLSQAQLDIKDLEEALKGKQVQPADFKKNPKRIFEELKFKDLVEKDYIAIKQEIEQLNKQMKLMLEFYQKFLKQIAKLTQEKKAND